MLDRQANSAINKKVSTDVSLTTDEKNVTKIMLKKKLYPGAAIIF